MNVNRVTLLGANTSSLASIAAASTQLADAQAQVSSGKRITSPSDDPAGTVSAMGLRGQLARSDQYATNSNDALAWLSTADSVYSQSVSVLQKAQTLVLQAQNTGAADATSQNAIADNLDSLRSTLLSLANTGYDGRPVFGGTTAGATAYAADGSYVGDDGAVTRLVAPGTSVGVNATGPEVFGAGGSDVFALLSSLSASLRAGGTVPAGAGDDLGTAIGRVSTAQAAEGGAYAQVQQLQTARTAGDTALKTRLGTVENVDMADAAVRLASADTAYQAALQTVASVQRQSLLDYLR